MSDNNCCQGSTKLIFSCSGAADVGAVVDQSARRLTKEGIGKMYCLTGIGGNISGIIETTKSADSILAIDGCPIACTRKLLERNGFNDFKYLEITSLGLKKGETLPSEENIEVVFQKGKEILSD